MKRLVWVQLARWVSPTERTTQAMVLWDGALRSRTRLFTALARILNPIRQMTVALTGFT
jgi:hypothetical protein